MMRKISGVGKHSMHTLWLKQVVHLPMSMSLGASGGQADGAYFTSLCQAVT